MTVAPILTPPCATARSSRASSPSSARCIGYLVAGRPGLVGALLGAALAAVFLGLTAVSILVAGA